MVLTDSVAVDLTGPVRYAQESRQNRLLSSGMADRAMSSYIRHPRCNCTCPPRGPILHTSPRTVQSPRLRRGRPPVPRPGNCRFQVEGSTWLHKCALYYLGSIDIALGVIATVSEPGA